MHTPKTDAETILYNGKIATQDENRSIVSAIAIRDGKVLGTGSDKDIMSWLGKDTTLIDLKRHTVIPGLNDSHTHLIRGGLNYNLELRWDGIPSLADGLRMLKEQAQRTPAGQWVRVVGGWTEFQFAERRMPTLEEINEVSPDTPVFVLHLYDRAFLNRAALRAVGYFKDSPNPPGGEIIRDGNGNPVGLVLAKPNAGILYSTLAKGPKLSPEYQENSTLHFMRELNRFGITSVIDAGGGFQNYPEDYMIVERLDREGKLTVRIAYNLFTQKPGGEFEDFFRLTKMVRPGQGNDYYRHNGAGEMLVFSAADFEDFQQTRPEMAATMEDELTDVIRLLAQNRWPFRLHATYDETITRALDVYEAVNREIPFEGLHWFIDHAETISERNIDRIAALGGGIAIQHRMAYQGEYFLNRYGENEIRHTPPVTKMLKAGLPVGAGTDATRVASYNPFVCLYWLITGKTVGGLAMYPEENRLDRMDALRLWTVGSSWFSTEDGKKGALAEGQLADLAVLNEDYFTIQEDAIKRLESVLTIVGGKPVYGSGEFSHLAPPAPPVLPDWSPVATYGGYSNRSPFSGAMARERACQQAHHQHHCSTHRHDGRDGFLWGSGCSCWAF